ncbi:MAG: hypothetical protein JWO36_658 [Myxococcales bacterium]|nr:hypothetical protein [Myxococcales bacterium]
MANILFVTLEETGHLTPTYPLARSLRDRGHAISYLPFAETAEGLAQASSQIEAAGFSAHAIPYEAYGEVFATPRGPLRAFREMQGWRRLRDRFVSKVGLLVTQLSAARPFDLVIVDSMMSPAHLVLAATGFRAALFSTNLFFKNPGPWSTPPYIPGTQAWRIRRAKANALDWWRYRFLRGLAMPLTAKAFRAFDRARRDPFTGFIEIVLCPREFEFPLAEPHPHRVYVGPSIDLERPADPDFPWSRLEGGPIIYAAFGTMTGSYGKSVALVRRALIDAAARRPAWRVLLVGGDSDDVPPNVVVVPKAPQIEVLSRANVMVTHAGLNSVKECIFFGVPMIAIPQAWDQIGNASRLTFHGLGLASSVSRCTADSLSAMLDEVLANSMYRERVARMKEIFRRAETDELAARAVERALSAPIDGVAEMLSIWRPSPVSS